VVLAATVAIGGVAAIPADAASGGAAYVKPPTISKLRCGSSCPGGTAARRRGAVAVQQRALLFVGGRSLHVVRTVVFLGRPGRTDNLSRKPSRVSRARLRVYVPRGAASGRIRVIDKFGRKSRSSGAWLRIMRISAQPRRRAPRFIWPVRGTLTGYFGEDRGGRRHSGLDIAAPTGTAVRAAASGRVTIRGWVSGYGNYICVAHRITTSCYAHLSSYKTTLGARVRQGQVIGAVGSTGNSTGPHLHFEIRRGTATWGTPVNPLPLLPRRSQARASSARRGPMDYDLPVFGPRG
jgi:hypothetical protein